METKLLSTLDNTAVLSSVLKVTPFGDVKYTRCAKGHFELLCSRPMLTLKCTYLEGLTISQSKTNKNSWEVS